MFLPGSHDWSLRFTWGQENRIDVSILFAMGGLSSSSDVRKMSRINRLPDGVLNIIMNLQFIPLRDFLFSISQITFTSYWRISAFCDLFIFFAITDITFLFDRTNSLTIPKMTYCSTEKNFQPTF
jgi:hypothetical protein